MATMLDLVGSVIVGGLVLLMMLGFKADLGTTTDAQCFNQGIQEDLRALTDVLEYDFRKMGYDVPFESNVKYINDSTIAFYGNFDNWGGCDSLQYYFRSIKPPGARNPSVGTLYRVLNTQAPQAIRLGVTRFKMLWYDEDGNLKPSVLKDIRSVKVSLTVESDYTADSIRVGVNWRRLYAGATWERTIRPKNLR